MFKPDLSNYFRKANKMLAIFALALGVLLCLSGCKSAELKTMENSASILQLTTGREVRRSLIDKQRGFTGPIYPEITIVYEPINNHTKKEVYDEIVAILKKNSWVGSEPLINDDFFKATLQQGNFEITADVVSGLSENLEIIGMTIY